MRASKIRGLLAILIIIGLVPVACSDQFSRAVPAPSVTASLGSPASRSAADSAGLPLLAVAGSGSGTFNLVHTASDRDATGDAQLTISVRQLPPDTVLSLMRAGDIGRPEGEQSDGVCQRAADGMFAPVIGPDGQPITMQTNAAGAGVLHVRLAGPTPDGTTIDAVYRLVSVPPGEELRTPCFMFTVK